MSGIRASTRSFGRALNFIRIWTHAHARIDEVLRDDLGAYPFVVAIRMPGDVGRTVGRRPGRLECATNGLRDHVWPACQPRVLGDRLDHLLLVGDLFEAGASAPA